MGKSAPKAPPAPDYAGAAKETAAGNLDMAKYQTEANRINQYTPWGSLTYNKTSSFDQAGYDAALADWQAKQPTNSGYWQDDPFTNVESGGTPTRTWVGTANTPVGTAPSRDAFMRDSWSQNEVLDPRIQAALDSQINVQRGVSDQANSMLGTVRDAYNQPFNAPDFNSYLASVGAVDQSGLGRAGQFSSSATVNTNPNMSGVNGVDQSGIQGVRDFYSGSRVDTNPLAWLSSAQALNQQLGSFSGNGSDVNTNTPTFDPARQNEYAKAAFDAQYSLMSPDLEQRETRLRNSLALQGLTPGAEASNNAMQEFNDARSRQLNALTSQSVLTGNEMSNRDFASQLAGFRSGNEAVGQRFGQDLTGFTTNRDTSMAENQARGQQFAQALQAFNTKNAAEGQRFDQDSNTFQNTMQARSLNNTLQQSRNQAQQQAFDQTMTRAQFGNDANAQQFAMDQASYDNMLRALSTNAGLQQAGNQAQQQAYSQALQNYGTNWQQAQTLRNMPLNELNALLYGQQVQNPEFENYALQQYVGGADLLGATQAKGQWDTNVYNQQAANASSQNQLLGSVAGAAATYF